MVRQTREPVLATKVPGHKVGPGQDAIAFQGQRSHRDEALPDARGQHPAVGCHRRVGLGVGNPRRRRHHAAVATRYGGRRAGKAVVLQKAVQEVILPILRRLGERRTGQREGYGDGGCNEHAFHGRASPGMTSVTAPSRVNIVARFTQTTTAATPTRSQLFQGCASGQNGLMSCQWNSIGSSRLPRALLKIGVTKMARVILPTKKGRKSHSAKTTPARKNAGRCQMPQTVPMMAPAQKGGDMTLQKRLPPRQPNSSIGPRNSMMNMRATMAATPSGSTGARSGPPLMSDPAMKTTGMPIRMKAHQTGAQHQYRRREKKARAPCKPP